MVASTTQVCYRCKASRPVAAFTQRVDDRHYNMCRQCVSEILTAGRAERGPRVRLEHTATERTCYLCRRKLPTASFTRRSNGTYFSACKDCNRHVFAQRRRSRLAGAEGTFSTAEWEELIAQYDRCPMCRRPWGTIPLLPGRTSVITADHIVPISKGGSNSIENIQPLCYSCNSKEYAHALPTRRRNI
jgi:hypothetical protein